MVFVVIEVYMFNKIVTNQMTAHYVLSLYYYQFYAEREAFSLLLTIYVNGLGYYWNWILEPSISEKEYVEV